MRAGGFRRGSFDTRFFIDNKTKMAYKYLVAFGDRDIKNLGVIDHESSGSDETEELWALFFALRP